MPIGVFGGLFDPFHKGHEAVVRAALNAGLSEVLLVPGPQKTPLRKAAAPAKDRIAMCRLIAQADERIQVCTIEAERQVFVPSCRTLAFLKKQRPDAEFVMLLGADKLFQLPRWMGFSKLFPLCSFLYFERAGVNEQDALCSARAAGARIECLPVPVTVGSSPVSRARIAAYEEDPSLPGSIAAYIAKNGLYHDDLLAGVRELVTEKRYRHILGVCQESVELAKIHGIPLQKAARAALLHDCAKCLPLSAMQSLAKRAGISPPDLINSSALLHGPVGAYVAQTRFLVKDEQVLDAIRYHTFGRPQMSPLELLIFVADGTEPTREMRNGLEEMRKLARISLPAAALMALTQTQRFLTLKQKPINPRSQETAEWLADTLSEDLKALALAQ